MDAKAKKLWKFVGQIIASTGSGTRWDKQAIELILDNIKKGKERSLPEILKIVAKAARDGSQGDVGTQRMVQNIFNIYKGAGLKVDGPMKEFAVNNLTQREISKVTSSKNQIGELEKILDVKYKALKNKAVEKQEELVQKVADLTNRPRKNGESVSQMMLDRQIFLDDDTFKRLTLKDKMKAFEELKANYNKNFRTKKSRNKYVRKNIAWNPDTEDSPSAGKEVENDTRRYKLYEDTGLFWGIETDGVTVLGIQDDLQEEFGFTRRDWNKKNKYNRERRVYVNEKYNDRELYDATKSGFEKKEVKISRTRRGQVKSILEDQSLSKQQRIAKLMVRNQKEIRKNEMAQRILRSVSGKKVSPKNTAKRAIRISQNSSKVRKDKKK